MEVENPGRDTLEWHPGFYGATELELVKNKDDLEFQREYNLGKKPLQMDLLVIKKLRDVRVANEIGQMFKTYNVIEYKSPDDGLTIDDYYKTVGYACLYKGLGNTVDAIPAGELTVTMVREGRPEKLFRMLRQAGSEIEEKYRGIYYIKGNTLFDTQIIVTGRLDKKAHRSLRILSRKAQEEDVRGFLEDVAQYTAQGDRENIEAVLQVSVNANRKLYQKIKIRRDFVMWEALKDLMKDEIEKEMQDAEEKATQDTLLLVIRNLMESMKWTAEQAMAAMKIPAADQQKYVSKL